MRLLPCLAFLIALLLPGFSLSAQCALDWLPTDPLPFLRGNTNRLGTWDPDGSGPLAPRLLAGGFGLRGGTFVGARAAAFDGVDWSEVALPPGGEVVRIGNVLGQTAVVTYHTLPVPGQPTFDYYKVSLLTPGGYTVVVDHVNGIVNAIGEYGGEMVFAGAFTAIGYPSAVPFARIARITTSGQLASLGSGFPGTVFALASYQGRLFAGGSFATAGGVAATNLAAWNGSTWAAVGNPNGAVTDLAVRNAIAITNTHLFAVGAFTAIGPLTAVGVARYNAGSNAWAAMSTPGPARSVAVRGVGTTGYELNVIRDDSRLYRWNGSGWSNLAPDFLTHLAYWNGQLVTAGYENDDLVAAYDGSALVPLAGRGIAGSVRAVLPVDAEYVIGGDFRTISGTVVNGIARGVPGAWQPLGTGFGGGQVRALARLPGGDVVAGGDFTTADGQPANGLARWNGSSWQSFGGGGPVQALLVMPNGDLVAAGAFVSIGGGAANRIARWNGTSWAPLGGGITGGPAPEVRCLELLANGDLLVGGAFLAAGPVATTNVARWNGSVWSGFGPGMAQPVVALDQLATGELIAWRAWPGGTSCASCNADVWNGLFWSPVDTGSVYPGVQTSGTLLPSGGGAAVAMFANALTEGHVAIRATPPNGSTAPWTRYPLGVVGIDGCLVAPNGDLVVFGGIEARGPVGGAVDTACSGFVRLRPSCAATATAVGSGCTGGGSVTFAASTLPWLGGVYRAQATGFGPAAIAVEVIGFQSVALPLAAVFATAVPGCMLWASPDVLSATLPTAGTVSVALSIPPTPSLVGVVLRDQFVELELTAGGFGAVRSSEALTLVLGSF